MRLHHRAPPLAHRAAEVEALGAAARAGLARVARAREARAREVHEAQPARRDGVCGVCGGRCGCGGKAEGLRGERDKGVEGSLEMIGRGDDAGEESRGGERQRDEQRGRNRADEVGVVPQ